MKKLISTLLSLFCVIGVACAFVGCGDADGGEVDASVYGLESAYEMGYLDEDDLKSIACRQYECYEIAENPYAGAYTQHTELSAKAEKDFKKIYCDKNERQDQTEPEIVYYYGTYDGNAVVEINCGFSIRKHIGGVVFTNADDTEICVLHYTEYRSDSATVSGRLYDLEKAYENGWLGEDDLKSLACYYYGVDSEENPYSGFYTKPDDKLSKEIKSELKDAYLRQVAETWSTRLDDASDYRYYGTYNGNIVVSIRWEGGCIYPIISDKEIGGVVFKNFNPLAFYVYHTFA